MNTKKVLYLGFHKTGTTSIKGLLSRMGLVVNNIWRQYGWDRDLSTMESHAMDIIHQFDGLQDNPWFCLYKPIDERFPRSKFIFYEREVNSWYASARKYFKARGTFGKKSPPMFKYIYGEDYACPLSNKEQWVKTYLNHSDNVRSYFKNRPKDFLEITDFSDKSAQQIGNFLGYENYQDLKMPHINKFNGE